MIGTKTKVLDHGFVELVDVMGDDSAIAQAARVSTQRQDKTDADDRGLIFRLMKDRHTTPFEMVEFKFNCKMPIFVARQWIRHRTASVNEMSARYSKLPGEFFLPESFRAQSKMGNKQVAEGDIDPNLEEHLKMSYSILAENAYALYEIALGEGIGRELARTCLPLSYPPIPKHLNLRLGQCNRSQPILLKGFPRHWNYLFHHVSHCFGVHPNFILSVRGQAETQEMK